MTRTLLAAMLLVLGMATAAGGAPAEVVQTATPAATRQEMKDYSGIWEGRCLFSKVEAHLRQKGDRIKGVALVHSITGSVNQYHFKGTIRNGRIEASHFRGHVFKGTVVSATEIQGSITTAKKKHVFKLDAKRVSDTPTRK